MIYIYIWANYNNSQTWNKAIWGWFPLLTMIPGLGRSEVVIIYADIYIIYVQYLLEIISNIPPIVGWCENQHLPTPTSKQTSWNSGRFLSPTNTVYYCIYCEKRGAWFCLVLWVEIGTTNSKQSIKQPPDFTFNFQTCYIWWGLNMTIPSLGLHCEVLRTHSLIGFC